jgi:hypothetical protein
MTKSRGMRWAGHVALMGEKGNVLVHRFLVRKPEERRPLEIPRRRYEGTIKIDSREIGWGGMEWILLAQDRGLWRALVNTALNLRVL